MASRNFLGSRSADEREAQHAESIRSHGGRGLGDEHVHAVDHRHHRDQRGGGKNDSQQRQEAPQLAAAQGIERDRCGFEKDALRCWIGGCCTMAGCCKMMDPLPSGYETGSAICSFHGRNGDTICVRLCQRVCIHSRTTPSTQKRGSRRATNPTWPPCSGASNRRYWIFAKMPDDRTRETESADRSSL